MNDFSILVDRARTSRDVKSLYSFLAFRGIAYKSMGLASNACSDFRESISLGNTTIDKL